MFTRVPREVCPRETGTAPIKTGWAETDKGQPGKPNVRERWVAKEDKTHARPELYASTSPLEALKVVLSEIATGERGEEVGALVDVRRAYFDTQHEGECSSHCRQRIARQVTSTCAGCCNTACTAHATPHKIGGRAYVDTQRSQVDERDRMPMRVARLHQGQTCRGNRAQERHHNRWRMIGCGILHQEDVN